MEVGLEMQDRPWQHINGDNGRASYHSLPPIAALTSCRPTSARKEDHVFSVPNPPKPAGVPAQVQRAPTPFPEHQHQQQRSSAPSGLDQPVRTSPVHCFPSSSPQPSHSPSERNSTTLSILPTSEALSSPFQTTEHRTIPSPHAFDKRSPMSVESSRSLTPLVSVPSPGPSTQSGNGSNYVSRNFGMHIPETGNNFTPNVAHGGTRGKDAHSPLQGNNTGIAGSPAICSLPESPRSYTPRNSPVPSPRSQGDRMACNQVPATSVGSSYNPMALTNFPVQSSHLGGAVSRTLTANTNSSCTISRTFSGPRHPSNDGTNRYSLQSANVPLEGMRHVSHVPTSSYDAPSSTTVQNLSSSSTGALAQFSAPTLTPSHDQGRANYSDRGVRYSPQTSMHEGNRNYARQNEKAGLYFQGVEPQRSKPIPNISASMPSQHPSFAPPALPRVSESAVSTGYSGFHNAHVSRQKFQSYMRPTMQNAPLPKSTSSLAPPSRSQSHLSSPQAIPYFRTDTSSLVWTSPTSVMPASNRPQDSSVTARLFTVNKVGHQTPMPHDSLMKAPPHPSSHGLPALYRHTLPQHGSHLPTPASSSREPSSACSYTQSYPPHSHHVSTSSTLPRINPPAVVNVTSTFTPRFPSPINQSSAPYHGAPRVPTQASEESRAVMNYPYAPTKQTLTPTTNGYSSGLTATLPRVNFPSPTAVSFDSSPSLAGSSVYASSRASSNTAPSSSHLQYSSQRHPVPSGGRDAAHTSVSSSQSRHHAYSQVQSHAVYSQQQMAALHSSQSHSRLPAASVVTSVPQTTVKYPPAHRQHAPNYTHNRTPEATHTAVTYSTTGETGIRPEQSQYAPRNPALETDTCRNPFELPPPSTYNRTQPSMSVIRTHHQSQRFEDVRASAMPVNYPPSQTRHDMLATFGTSDTLQTSRYASVSRSLPVEDRQKPLTVSARFPPVPQMNYDLQRHIYDRMTGGQKTPPRLAEKRVETERRSASKPTENFAGPQVSTSALTLPQRSKRESPLDLSVKTVRQSADSTKDDSDLYASKNLVADARIPVAPKIDFTPNFAGPLVHSETRNMVSLPPVQTIRNFPQTHTDPSALIQSALKRKPVSEPEPAHPPKIPKIDAWKLAMDEQIEERLKAARPQKAQPAAPLTPAHPPIQNTTPTNPELHSRMRGYIPSPGYSAAMPPRHESPVDSSPLHRPTPHEQMLQQMKKGRESLESPSPKQWGMATQQKVDKTKAPNSAEKPTPPAQNDTQHLVEQISKGVIADARFLQDSSVINLLRSSLVEKEARLHQLQDAARKKQKLPPFNSVSLERICVPPSYKHTAPRTTDTVKIGVEPTRNYLRPPGPEKPQDGTDLDGLAAFLAARIRTKAEMKQMAPSSETFRTPEPGPKPGVPTSSPPKLAREGRVLSSPHRRRSDETLAAPPPRDPAGLRSSSETSVFDFRESDSEGEMPVLERQTLEGMRRDRKAQPRPSLPPPPEPEPGPSPKEQPEMEPDPLWDNACDMFVDQLQKRPVKRSIRKKKPNPKFFANESEAPDFLKVKTEEELIKKEPALPVEATVIKEFQKPKNVQMVKKEVEEFLSELTLPTPVINEDDTSSSSGDELPVKTGKETKAKTVTKRQRAVRSDSEWESSGESHGSSSSSNKKSGSSESSSDSESEVERAPKGRRVQTRQQSKAVSPPSRMKLRSKRRAAANKDDAFRPGWEEELYKFKQQLRMPERLINISKPRKRGPSSLPDLDSDTEKNSPKAKKGKKGEKAKKDDKLSKKKDKVAVKKKGKKEEKTETPSKGKSKDRPSSAPPLTRRNFGIVTRGKEKILRNGASAAVRRSNKAVQNSKRHLNKGKKRLKLRRKFRSGFDYMRRKKKQPGKKDSESTAVAPAEPKRRERTDAVDVSAEVKSWVVNKGAGETVLHRAARLGYSDVAAYCLETLKVTPSPRDHAGYTPLHEACSRGHLAVAKLLLQYGASVSESARGGVRPLHQAAENNHAELIRLLLSYGADPLLATYTGQTAMSLTTQEEAQCLINQHLADVRGEDAPKWVFQGPSSIFADPDWSVSPLDGAPSPEPIPVEIEFEGSLNVLPPLYRLPDADSTDRWMLVEDLVAFTQAHSVENLLSQIPETTLREITDDDFREHATSCNILAAPNSSGRPMQLVKYDEAVRQMMDVEVISVSLFVDE